MNGLNTNGGTTDHGYSVQPLGTIPIQSGNSTTVPIGPGQDSEPVLFKALLTSALIVRPGGQGLDKWEPIHGIQFFLMAGDAAELLLTVKDSIGVQTSRRFTLTRGGLFLGVAGWQNADCVVVKGLPKTKVAYAWQSRPPRPESRMIYVQAIQAGEATIPDGAVAVAASSADSGWTWRTDIGAGAVDVAQPQPGGGVERQALGARYVATLPNQVTWFLDSP